ncbi:MAG: T9SS type A sorting domain-containing protein [Bacteroidetes bacterium]|nr:T9SS type A sorting domain-containing protein [Bacteroidota bacterium]
MKKNILVVISLLCTCHVMSQEIVSTQGDSYSNGNGSIGFTIGEAIIDTRTDGTFTITQGFHQSSWRYLGIEDHVESFDVSLYPNPTSEFLNIKTANFKDVFCSIYDAQGKLVLNNQLTSELTSIKVSHLSSGAYSVSLISQNQTLKTFKLVKNQ